MGEIINGFCSNLVMMPRFWPWELIMVKSWSGIWTPEFPLPARYCQSIQTSSSSWKFTKGSSSPAIDAELSKYGTCSRELIYIPFKAIQSGLQPQILTRMAGWQLQILEFWPMFGILKKGESRIIEVQKSQSILTDLVHLALLLTYNQRTANISNTIKKSIYISYTIKNQASYLTLPYFFFMVIEISVNY